MSNQKLRFALVLPTFLFALALVVLNNPQSVLSAASHIVISEIKIGDVALNGGADNEFIELYNPTENPINLSGWRLSRKTSGGTSGNLVASMSGTIAPHGYFLVGSPEFAASSAADLQYGTSTRLAANNTVLLYSDAGTTVVDKVGMGTATDVEATAAANPVVSESIERKATASTTTSSMIVGGPEEFLGNGEDTDNNSNDFVFRAVPQPQTASSSAEPVLSTPTPSATQSATPSVTASATPTPTITPTPSATSSATPTPSATASATPSASPTATPTPLPIPSPSVIASFPLFNGSAHVCTLSYTQMNFGFFSFNMPKVSCVIVTL